MVNTIETLIAETEKLQEFNRMKEVVARTTPSINAKGQTFQQYSMSPDAEKRLKYQAKKDAEGKTNAMETMKALADALGILEPFTDMFTGFAEILGTAFFPAINTLFTEVFVPMIPVIQDFATALSPILSTIVSLITESALFEAALNTITGTVTTITGIFEGITTPDFDWSDFWTKVKTAFSTGLDNVWNDFKTIIENFWTILVDLFEDAINTIFKTNFDFNKNGI